MNTEHFKVKSDNLVDFCANILRKVGLSTDEATYVASLLVESEMRGRVTHGIMRLPMYVELIKSNAINPTPKIVTIKDENSVAILDGDHGIGQIVATKAFDMAIIKASKFGLGIVGVINSGHLGELGLLSRKVLPHRMIGSIMSNGGPIMAAWGGATPVLGNNPFAVCIPRCEKPPIIIDMALSKTARGNIIKAEKENEDIPEGIALDKNGNPTIDPSKALEGSILPMANHKGYALALLVEILTSVLSGGTIGPKIGKMYPVERDQPLKISHLITVINIENFIGWEQFQNQLGELVHAIKQSKLNEKNVFIPGERSQLTYQHNFSREEIVLSYNGYMDLIKLGEEYNVKVNLSI